MLTGEHLFDDHVASFTHTQLSSDLVNWKTTPHILSAFLSSDIARVSIKIRKPVGYYPKRVIAKSLNDKGSLESVGNVFIKAFN